MTIVAEGIKRPPSRTLPALGVRYGQGFLSRPGPWTSRRRRPRRGRERRPGSGTRRSRRKMRRIHGRNARSRSGRTDPASEGEQGLAPSHPRAALDRRQLDLAAAFHPSEVVDHEDPRGSHSPMRTRSRVRIRRSGPSHAPPPHPSRCSPITSKSDASSIQSLWCSQSVISSQTTSGGPGIVSSTSITTGRGFFGVSWTSWDGAGHPERRSIDHDEAPVSFVYCFISIATVTASA